MEGGVVEWQPARTLDLFHGDLTWQALAVCGLEASALISPFNYCKSEEPQPMLMKPHQSAGGETRASRCTTILCMNRADTQPGPEPQPPWMSIPPSVCLSHSTSRFISVVCPGAKPSSYRGKKSQWILNEPAATAVVLSPACSLHTTTSDNNTKYGWSEILKAELITTHVMILMAL